MLNIIILLNNSFFWLILSFISILFELIVLYIQYIIGLKPCLLCIYQRFFLFVLIISGLIISLTKKIFFHFSSIMLWVYSSWKGLLIAIKQTKIYYFKYTLYCDFFVFPYWLPLDRWIPSVFSVTEHCFEYKNRIFSLVMSQLMIIIFIIYLCIGLIKLFNILNKIIFKNFNKK